MRANIIFPLSSEIPDFACEFDVVPRVGDFLEILGVSADEFPVEKVVFLLARTAGASASLVDNTPVTIYLGEPSSPL